MLRRRLLGSTRRRDIVKWLEGAERYRQGTIGIKPLRVAPFDS
jgi:hypothetical protein